MAPRRLRARGLRAHPCGRQHRDGDPIGFRDAHLNASAGRFDVLEDRSAVEACLHDLGAGSAEEIELLRLRGDRVDTNQGPDVQPESRQGERSVGHRAAEPPASGIVRREVARRRADHEHDRVVNGLGCILQAPFLPFGVDRVFL